MAGPSDNQPINPNLADSINRMASASEVFAKSAQTLEASLDASSKHTEVMMKNLDTTKLADLVSIFDDVEEATKEIAGYARKMRSGIFNTRNAADAVKYANQIKEAQKEMLKKTKENTLAWQASSRSIEKLDGFVAKMQKRVGDMNSDELREFGKILHEAEQSADKLFKKFKDAKLGHVRRQMQGMARVLLPDTMNKADANRAKHTARAEALREQTRNRLSAGRAHADDRRAKAIGELRKNPTYTDKAGNIDLGKESTRQALAAKMGFRGERAKTFIRGEHQMALGGSSGGEKYEKLMAHGGGGIGGALSQVATVMETAGAGIEGALAAVAPEIEVLALVIGALVEAFESFTKQNKQMEQAVGAGGIFTAGGDAFANARASLNPRGGGYTQLGGTFERNLAMAQAVVAGGRNVQELVNGGPDTANMMPGAKGEFMSGPIGQMQRIAMGVGRVSGLTDVQSIETVLKNLDQYGQTIEGTEKFFVQLNKDTKAAGVSTTKYLQIIDEVSSHFDRMNKSLGETMGFLRELGRTGAIGTETLKDLTAFLAGGPKADAGNVAQRGFLEMNMRGGLAQARVAGERSNISGFVTENLMPALKNIFPEGQIPPQLANIANMPEKQAQQMISSLRDKVAHAVDAQGNPISATTKQAATEALTNLSNSVQKLGAYSRGGGLNRAMAIGMTGDDMVGTTAQQLNRMEQMSKRTGIPMAALVSGDFSGVSGERLQMAQQLATQVMGVDNPQAAQSAMRGLGQTMGQNRLDAAVADKNMAVALTKELGGPRSKLFKLWLANQKDDVKRLRFEDQAQKFLIDNHDQLVTQTGALDTTRDWFVRHASRIPGVTDQEQAQALAEARRIGRQTQGIEDAIKNALHVWMTKLVSGVEWIADHFLGSGGEKDRQALQDRFNQTQGQAESMSSMLEKAMGKNREDAKDASDDQKDALDAQYQKMQDVERHLSDMKDQSTFMSKEQADQMDADKKFVMGLGTNAPTLGGKTAAVGSLYGQYFASDTQGIRAPKGMMDINGLLNSINQQTPGGSSKVINQNFYGNANTKLTPQGTQVDSNEKVMSNGQAQ